MTDEREYPLFHLVNKLVREARRNEKTMGPEWGVEKLVHSLSHQAPNRLYFNSQGNICSVLIFSENSRPYESFIQVARLEEEHWQTVHAETISCVDVDALEQEISWWRRRYQMRGDLIERPSGVFRVIGGTEILDGSFVHVADAKPKLPVSYYYQIGGLGPRLLAVDVGGKIDLGDSVLNPLVKPPKEITAYARPFTLSSGSNRG